MSTSDLFESEYYESKTETEHSTLKIEPFKENLDTFMLDSYLFETNDEFEEKMDVLEEFEYTKESLGISNIEDIIAEKPSQDVTSESFFSRDISETSAAEKTEATELKLLEPTEKETDTSDEKMDSECYVDLSESSIEIIEENFNTGVLESFEEEEDEFDNEDSDKENFDWPKKDIDTLINTIEGNLPKRDRCSYKTRASKLNWNKIAFKDYTPEECREKWMKIQGHMRKNKTLSEALGEVEQILKKQAADILPYDKHDSKPGKPQSAFILFQEDIKQNIMKENPGIDAIELVRIISSKYRKLTNSEKGKYKKLAAEQLLEYKLKKKQFYDQHPECPRTRKELLRRKEIARLDYSVKTPRTPFGTYLDAQLKKSSIQNEEERLSLIRQYKEEWTNMAAETKVFWINWAEQQYILHKKEDPLNCKVKLTDILSRAERKIQRQYRELPSTVTQCGYHIFVKKMLEQDEMKKLNLPSPDNLYFISLQWSYLNENEKAEFRYFAENEKKNHKTDFDEYLGSLPEHQKYFEHLKSETLWKKEKLPKANQTKHSKKACPKLKEPVPPESSIEEYYRKVMMGKKKSVNWRECSARQKQKYEKDWLEQKKLYIVEYEKFLNSLSTDELQEYTRKLKSKQCESASNSNASESDDSAEET